MPMGHNPRTITAANAIVLFTAEGFYDQPIQWQGFQVDNMISFGDAAIGETRIGVDGKQSGGWVPHEVPVTSFFEANSPSRVQMEDYRAWLNKNQETSLCTIDATFPSTGRRVVAKGYMTSLGGGTSAQKLLNGTQYVFNMVINGEDSLS